MPLLRGTIQLARIALSKGDVQVDLENKCIRNVSIIQDGEALGHDFLVDATMREQVLQAINSKPKGVKSRLTHPGLSDCGGYDGIEVLVGRVKNARMDGDKVRGDAYLGDFAAVSPAGDLRSYLLAIAQEDPELIGLSIAFDPDEFIEQEPDPATKKPRLPLGRVKDVMAADFVGDPAANRDGLLSRLPKSILKAIPAPMLARWQQDVTQLTNGGKSPQTQTSKESQMNPQLKAYLVTLGLAATATDDQAKKFLNALNPATRKKALAVGRANGLELEDSVDPEAMDGGGPGKFCTNCGGAIENNDKYCGLCGGRQVTAMAAKPKTPEELAAAAETKRREDLKEIATLGKMGDEWLNQKVLAQTSVEDARKEALAKVEKGMQDVSIIVGADQNLSSLRSGLSDALSLRANRPIVECDSRGIVQGARLNNGEFQPKYRNPHERANHFRYMGLMDMARICLEADGISTLGMSKPEIARLAFNRGEIVRKTGNVRLYQSTADFPNILADQINKELGVAFQLAPDTTFWCRERPIPDFKQATTTKLSAAPKLTQVTPGADYEFSSFGDQGEKYTLAKYGKIIVFNWETLINDDLNAFTIAPQAMGLAAKALKVDLVYGILTANPNMSDTVALFHATHGNLFTGGGSALSITAWGTLKAGMAKQKSNGQLLNTTPKYLLIPLELEAAAANILVSNALLSTNGGTTTTQQNPYAGTARVVPEARLSVASAATWYAAADPGLMDTIEIGTLEGEPQPVVEQEMGFEVDGRKMKVRYTVATKAADYRGLAKSAGA